MKIGNIVHGLRGYILNEVYSVLCAVSFAIFFAVIVVIACEQNAGKSRTAPKAAQTEPVKISLKDCLACR